ncbi:MAG: hypothetical protein JWO03_4047 [Bacteroidetes bacterium]|nr:hypothetical protein [Bacteroidota bacterium]
MKTFSFFSAAEAAGPGVLWSRSNRELYHRGVTYHYVFTCFYSPSGIFKRTFLCPIGECKCSNFSRSGKGYPQKKYNNFTDFCHPGSCSPLCHCLSGDYLFLKKSGFWLGTTEKTQSTFKRQTHTYPFHLYIHS